MAAIIIIIIIEIVIIIIKKMSLFKLKCIGRQRPGTVDVV